MADYDNAVLYGDWIVSELMRSFSDKEAIVFFFPDHALDIYDSDPSYVGHTRPTNPQSVQAGLQIPFLVYTTASYREHFLDKNARLIKSVDKPYNTEDLVYTIMDLANASFADDPSLAEERSLLFESIAQTPLHR
jgi:heptose-I-phosphate ethanolaminephosphotransferase